MALFHRNQARTPEVIDLREPAAPSKPRWGFPFPCPSCGGRGYLDRVDPRHELMYLHCTECLEKYELAKADSDAGADAFPL